jgi:hypothetical protein
MEKLVLDQEVSYLPEMVGENLGKGYVSSLH